MELTGISTFFHQNTPKKKKKREKRWLFIKISLSL